MVENRCLTFKKKFAYCVGASCIAVFIFSIFGASRPKVLSESCLESCEVSVYKKLAVEHHSSLTPESSTSELEFWNSSVLREDFSFLKNFTWSKKAKLFFIRGPPQFS
ncbi:hypothetical protein [Halobacteriovorax sp. HLS]|uniref:hypothetical protein n=1 Tax=Halobacteriovorax sp. HLS TaxID=2234000 RepID=UPI000FDBC043|nr:hypothetical protein [Halobacteriovorax sp. HLS]